ncbi:MAG TPA: hypothetical protein VHF70_05620, partial [Rubrobacteraceae bacterium]|nr:hypothetical protein [Rubrobacteraceae bacterium]
MTSCVLALVLPTKDAKATTLPAGFEDKKVASVGLPTALAPMPDGRVLVASKSGRLRVYEEGQGV